MHQYGAGTDVGNSRDNNEDSYVCDPDKNLWMVADGMGGLGFGEVASAITIYTVTTLVREGHGINQAIELAHKKIKEFGDQDGVGVNMGTTIVLLLSHGSLYNIFWVGDSRAYLFQGSSLNQLTVDHSLVQSLIDQGEITQLQAESDPRRNAVTRALGVHELETVRADSISDKWRPGQKVLLCSDGLTDSISHREIAAILGQEGTDQDKVDKLIETALEQGGQDNITVVLVSAPDSASNTDSDTESPGKRKAHDQTQVPDEEDAGQRNQRPADGYNIPGDYSAKGRAQPAWQKVLLALTLVTTIAIFANLDSSSPEPNMDTSPIPSTTVPPEAHAFEQKAKKVIPEFPEPSGARIQVGVFKALEGAESRQKDISDLGLTPWVRKRATQQGILYVVLLGPYDDEQRRQSVTEQLDANNLSYFQRPPRG
ncbi:MAG: protein phosphatase 2C domain-containing protein [Pseudomonadales bacterium]